MEADTWLFHGNMRSKHTDMCEIWASTGVLLVRCMVSRQSSVWKSIFYVNGMPDSMRPVGRVQIRTREHGTHHVSELVVWPLDYRILEGGASSSGLQSIACCLYAASEGYTLGQVSSLVCAYSS